MTETADATILLLDDEPMVTRSLESLLRMETSWTILSFNRPEDAIAAILETAVDAVVADFLMPRTDGLEFLRRVKERDPLASRILLTGYADKQNAIRSINEVGLYQYVEKPWDNEAMLLLVRNAVERTRILRRVEELVRKLAERDRSLESLRSSLLKAIV